MKRFIFFIFIIILAIFSTNGWSAVEKILGDDTLSSETYVTNSGRSLLGMEFTASWSGNAKSVQCNTGKVYIGGWDAGTQHVKIFVFESGDNGGNLIAESDETRVKFDAWNTVKFPSPFKIIKSNTYRLAFALKNEPYVKVYIGSGVNNNQPEYAPSSSTYSNPDDIWVTDWNLDSNSLSIYLQADTSEMVNE